MYFCSAYIQQNTNKPKNIPNIKSMTNIKTAHIPTFTVAFGGPNNETPLSKQGHNGYNAIYHCCVMGIVKRQSKYKSPICPSWNFLCVVLIFP